MSLDPGEDIIVTVTPRTAAGAKHADFLAAELATALDNLGAVSVATLGEFGHPNSAGERWARLDRLRQIARAEVSVLVIPGDEEDGEVE